MATLSWIYQDPWRCARRNWRFSNCPSDSQLNFVRDERGGMKMMKAISLYRYTAIYEAQVNAHWIPIPSWVVRCETREGQVVRKFMCSWQYTMMLFICICSYRPIGYVVMLQFQGDVLSIWSNRHDAREHDGIIPKRYILWLDLISIQFRIFEESCAQSRSTFIVNWSQQKNKKHSPDPFSLSKWKWCVHCNGNIYRHTTRFDFWFLAEVSCRILSFLLQGNSSLVDTWERCYAKSHRRKKNKHRMDHVGPKWPVGELETLDFSGPCWRPSNKMDDLGRMLGMEEKWHEIYHENWSE